MPIGDRPVLDIVMRQLPAAGFGDVTIATGYLADVIQAYFRDGLDLDMRIDYFREDEPLGTVGALALIGGLDDDFLVMNGDVLTDMDYVALLAHHRENRAAVTVAVTRRTLRSQLGVMRFERRHGPAPDHRLRREADARLRASMGVYCFSPAALRHIEPGVRLDFPDLVCAAAGGWVSASEDGSRRPTGWTSGATTTTSRRSTSSRRCATACCPTADDRQACRQRRGHRGRLEAGLGGAAQIEQHGAGARLLGRGAARRAGTPGHALTGRPRRSRACRQRGPARGVGGDERDGLRRAHPREGRPARPGRHRRRRRPRRAGVGGVAALGHQRTEAPADVRGASAARGSSRRKLKPMSMMS